MTNAQRPQVFLGRDRQHGAHHLLGWWPTISLTTSTTNYAIKNNTNKPTLHPAAHTATLHTIPSFSAVLAGRLSHLKLLQLAQARKVGHNGWQTLLEITELLRGRCSFLNKTGGILCPKSVNLCKMCLD